MTRASDLARHQVAFKTALIEFTDGDDAITVADGGVVTLLNTAVVKAEGGSATNNIAQGQVKQWVRTSTASVTVADSFNTASVTDSGVGLYAPQFTNNMNNTNYAVHRQMINKMVAVYLYIILMMQ